MDSFVYYQIESENPEQSQYVNLEKNPGQEGASYLEYSWNLFCLSSVHVSLRDWSDVKQFAAQDGTKFAITNQKTLVNTTTCNLEHEKTTTTYSISSTIEGLDCSLSCSSL